MRRRNVVGVLLATLALTGGLAGPSESADESSESPVATTLQERVETRLVQIDVAVDGPPDVVDSLGEKDFGLTVGGKAITAFTVDRVCDEQAASAPTAGASRSFLFFFDQPHLTQVGRSNALDMARELINQLVTRGAKAAIVSSANKLQTVVPLTGDRSALIEGLDRLRQDATQRDGYADQELVRVDQLLYTASQQLARSYADEEAWQARRSTQRLSIALGLLGNEPPPRAAFYFAYNLRKDAGQHYLDVGGSGRDSGTSSAAAFDFDRLIRDALGFGVHLFPVEAVGENSMTGIGEHASRRPSAGRAASAVGSLVSLGSETGGEAFLGVPAGTIAARVRLALGCIYVLSFKPGGVETDKTLPVTVRMTREGVTARSQGLIVVPSASTRKTARLLAAFAQGTTDDPSDALSVSVTYLSAEKKQYRGLIQVRTPQIALRNGSWDLGASLLSGGSVRDNFSVHLSADASGVPFVVEKEVTLGSGPYEIVAVGQLNGDRVFAGRIEGVLPAPGDGAVISPIVALQQRPGAFSRDGKTRTSGTIALQRGELVDGRKPLALVAVVCRAGHAKSGTVRRTLRGGTAVSFEPIQLDAANRCVQVRDVIPEKSLGHGSYSYLLESIRGDEVVHSDTLVFDVAQEPESHAAAH